MLTSPRALETRFSASLAALAAILPDALPRELRASVRFADHRQDIGASLEVFEPGLALRTLDLINRGQVSTAVAAVGVALRRLHEVDPDVFCGDLDAEGFLSLLRELDPTNPRNEFQAEHLARSHSRRADAYKLRQQIRGLKAHSVADHMEVVR